MAPVDRTHDYEAHVAWLRERLDPASEGEWHLLNVLAAEGLRLPDYAQHCPEPDVAVQVDFYFT